MEEVLAELRDKFEDDMDGALVLPLAGRDEGCDGGDGDNESPCLTSFVILDLILGATSPCIASRISESVKASEAGEAGDPWLTLGNDSPGTS